MGQDDEYREKAAEAQRWAAKAVSEDERAAWLRVVEGWLSLIRTRPQPVTQQQHQQPQPMAPKPEDKK